MSPKARVTSVMRGPVGYWHVDDINESLEALVVPVHLQGRFTMASRTMAFLVIPVAKIAGGFLAHAAGSQALLMTAAAIGLIAALWVVRAGIPQLEDRWVWQRVAPSA